jgi:hypothetical protein
MMAILGIEPRSVKPEDPAHAAATLLFRYVLGSETAKAEIAALPPESRVEPTFYVGKMVRLETKPKSAEKPFTRHFWSPVAAE